MLHLRFVRWPATFEGIVPGSKRVGLFVPCYIDQVYPDVGLACLEILEAQGVEVGYPPAQTGCGQPMANTGCTDAARPLAEHFVRTFAAFDAVVCPSGSCVSMVVNHYKEYFPAGHPLAAQYGALSKRTFELCQYLVDVLGVTHIEGRFPYRVGVHQSCHGLRELRLGPCSERMDGEAAAVSRIHTLLQGLEGIEMVGLQRPDECCGFGGTFAVAEEAVSTMMGRDRIADHQTAGAQVMTAGDMSCLMHMEGLIRRDGHPLAVMHVAQILAGRQPAGLTADSAGDPAPLTWEASREGGPRPAR